jgi:hypothetical protein
MSGRTPAQEGASHATHGRPQGTPRADGEQADACARGGPMLFDFSEAERNTTRRALEIYVTELREEIVKTEKHEWREALHLEKRILEGVIEQLCV